MGSTAPIARPVGTAQLFIPAPNARAEYDQFLRLAGQEITVKLVGHGVLGAKLELPSGRVIEAKGDLAFPEQTQIRVGVTLREGSVRLQILEAKPPTSPTVLTPLIQSEAASLLQKIQASDLPAALVPLAGLFAELPPSKEMQLRRAVETMPDSTRQLLASLLGMKDPAPALIAQYMLERFDPLESLDGLNPTLLGANSTNPAQIGGPEQQTNTLENLIMNNLNQLLSNLFASMESNTEERFIRQQLGSFFQSLKTDISSLPVFQIDELSPSIDGEKLPNILIEKFSQALTLLPKNVHDYISRHLTGSGNDFGSTARALAENALNSANAGQKTVSQPSVILKSFNGDTSLDLLHQSLRQVFDNLPDVARGIISHAITGSTETSVGRIADHLVKIGFLQALQQSKTLHLDALSLPEPQNTGAMPDYLHSGLPAGAPAGNTAPRMDPLSVIIRQVITMMTDVARNSLSEAILGTQIADDANLAKTITEQINFNSVVKYATLVSNPVDDSHMSSDMQLLIRSVGNLPLSVRNAIYWMIKDLGVKHQDVFSNNTIYDTRISTVKPETSSPANLVPPEIRQALTTLPNSVQTELLSKISDSVELEQGTNPRPLPNGPPIPSQGTAKDDVVASAIDISNSDFLKPEPLGLTRALETLPPFLQRAMASLLTGSAEAGPKSLAECLVLRGNDFHYGQTLPSQIETAPPLIRQIVAILVQAPQNVLPKHMSESVLAADASILEGVKGILSFAKDGTQPPSSPPAAQLTVYPENKRSHDMLGVRLNYLLRFETLLANSNFCAEDKSSISSWFRSILDHLIFAKTFMSEVPEARSLRGQYGFADNASNGPGSAVASGGQAEGEKPQSWHSLLKNGIKTLGDPAVFPKEASFHALAAKENVNYFELPLPWVSGRTVEIWIENDGDDDPETDKAPILRVLMALNFSVLGETRVGIESAAKRMTIKIWAQRPQPIENRLLRLKEELSDLGFAVQVSLNALAETFEGVPTPIKSIINGSSLHAVG